jgi:pathogenesis-related protein 1
MIYKPIMILPLALAGILILAILTVIPSNNHAFAFGNSFTFASSASSEENNNTGNGQENSNAANGQENNNTGNGQENSNAANGPTSQQSNSTGIAQQSNNTNAYGNTQADFVNTILGIHNPERAAVGIPPLVWSDKLAADAKTYAEHLIATGVFSHPSAEWVAAHPTGPEGENLASRSPQNPNELAQMAEGWVAEKNNYHGEPGDFNGVGHYTQMVWNTTKAVGCATASGGGRDILDCRYSPPGNYLGEKPY